MEFAITSEVRLLLRPRASQNTTIMSSEFQPVVWRGRDLSSSDAIFYYRGRCYVRPLGRGVVLSELELAPHLDDVLAEGDYQIEIRVTRRLPKP